MNIVSMVLQYLTPALIGKLGAGAGTSQSATEQLVKAAVPVVLAALAGKVAKSEGARALFDILAKQDTALLGRLAGVLGGAQQKILAEQGSNALGTLFGPSAAGSIVGAMAKYAGVNAQQAGGVVGMLAPVVLGTLAQQQKSAKLDAGGIAKLLSDQKKNIQTAIPGDLAKALAATGLLDAVLPRPATPSASPSANPTAGTAPRVVPAATSPAVPFNGWPWAVLIIAASALWASLFSGPPSPWSSIPAPPRLMAGDTDVAAELDNVLKSVHGLMATVRDRSTAENSMPQFRAAAATIERLADRSRQLDTAEKRTLAGHVSAWIEIVRPLAMGLTGNTQAGPVLKPMLDQILARLEGLAKV